MRTRIPTSACISVAAAVAFALAQAAHSQDTARHEVAIEPQPIATALKALAAQTGLQLVVFSEDAGTRQSPQIRGVLTNDEALDRILRDSGLTYRRIDDNTVAIQSTRAKSAIAGCQAGAECTSQEPLPLSGDQNRYDGIRLSQVDPATGPSTAGAQAAGQVNPTDALEEVVVTSQIIFTQNDAFGATKMGLPLKDTPQTVAVVTGDMIEFAGIRTFNDFYKVDASSGTSHMRDGSSRNYFRGYQQQQANAIRVDGFRMNGTINLDLALFDRFEVVKGPTSTLYGQNSIGGILNAVSKVPQGEFAANIGFESGEYDHYRAEVDSTGPLAGSDRWSYRLVGAWQDDGSFLDFTHQHSEVFSASLQYELSDATTFLLRGIYQEDSRRGSVNGPPILQIAGNGSGDFAERLLTEGLKIADVPRSRLITMPWSHADTEAKFLQVQGDHLFGNGWKLRAHAQYNDVTPSNDVFFVVGPFDQDGFAYFNSMYSFDDHRNSLYGGEVSLFGDLEVGGRKQTLFFGIDYNRLGSQNRWSSAAAPDVPNFNLFQPAYGSVPVHDSFDDYTNIYDTNSETSLFGATVQLITHPSDRLSVLLAARYSVDSLELDSRTGPPAGAGAIDGLDFETTDDLEFREMVYQAGVTFELTQATNLYASYGETFEPKTGRIYDGTLGGEVIDPEEGTSYEIGLKSDLTRNLNVTLAAFHMERTNIAQPDTRNPGFQIAIGTQRSRGVELGAQGRLSPELSVSASLAFLDADFSEGEFTGLKPANAPKFGASLFASYEILHGALDGLGFGFGVVHKRGRETFDAGWTQFIGSPVIFDFGSFTEVDARVFYGRDHWRFSIAGTNLFNEKYYSPAWEYLTTATSVNPPRTIIASVNYRF